MNQLITYGGFSVWSRFKSFLIFFLQLKSNLWKLWDLNNKNNKTWKNLKEKYTKICQEKVLTI